VIATADAYPNGGPLQRAKALIWLEKALNQDSLVHAESIEANWWRSEILLALHVLVDH
jgi:hypothetical protein